MCLLSQSILGIDYYAVWMPLPSCVYVRCISFIPSVSRIVQLRPTLQTCSLSEHQYHAMLTSVTLKDT